jgi:hypothetical protein
MSTGNSSGETGRCDAKCYNASGGNCHCCCGGANHGVGIEKARDNIQKYADSFIEKWKEKHAEDHFTVENVLF